MAKAKSKSSDPKSPEARIKDWAYGFLHSPAGFDGKRPEDILAADMQESQNIFKRELPKRKATESMKVFKTRDDLELRYWFVERPNNTKIKILVHGSGSNFAKADRAVPLLDRGFNVAMISYRGHSGNPGKADQRLIVRDVMDNILHIINSGYEMKNIYLEGSSLGTASLAHAVKRIYQEFNDEQKFAGLLLKAAPLNLNDRDKDTVESLKAAGISESRAQPYLKKLWNQEDAYSKIYAEQITIVHGSDDDVVPVEHAQRIKDLLVRNNTNVDLHIIQAEGHRLDLNQYEIYL